MTLDRPLINDFNNVLYLRDIKNYGVDCYKYIDPVVGIQRKWQSLDSISVKAPLGGR
jgi:hypothetical protein